MRQLYYTILTILRGHGSNVIKVISLTLGLFIGIILFARVAYELSYNIGYQDHERLYIILSRQSPDEPSGDFIRSFVPRAFMESYPGEIEAGTLTKDLGEHTYYVGNQRYTGQAMFADTLFFKTMGISATSGEVTGLAVPGNVFVSEEFAMRAFHTKDVIGKTLMRNKKQELTIRGTFRNVADNNAIRPDVLLAYGDEREALGLAFNGYIRLYENVDVRKVNERIDVVMKNYLPAEQPGKEGSQTHFFLEDMRKEHNNNPEVKRIVFVLSFLAIALLLISAMNYVLISISGLAGRIKGIAVHKCNGASSRGIFSMFFWETAVIILISMVIVVLLTVNLNGFIGELIEARVSSLFTLKNLWVPVGIIIIILTLSAIIPGTVYSGIPVTQLFQKYTNSNTLWKKILLFVQFAGVAFIFGVSVVAFSQYQRIINFDLGYETHNMAAARLNSPNIDAVAAVIDGLPMVEEIVLSRFMIYERGEGDMVRSEKDNKEFSSKLNWIGPEFVDMHKLVILEGRNVISPGEVIVNEEYTRRMSSADGVIGKNSGNFLYAGQIVGVFKDFVVNSLFEEQNSMILSYETENRTVITVKLREPFEESLINLNREVQALFSADDVIFTSHEKQISDKYLSVRRFRDSAGVAFAAILIIALMGLFGYINDEIQRRSKEIGIRKVNGAQAGDILQLLNKDISIVGLPAVALGTFFSYFVGREWLDQFSGTQIDLNIPFYILLIIIMIVLITTSVIAKSWGIANDNPVNSIKSE